MLKHVSDNDNQVSEAKEKELKNLDQNNVYEWVADNGQNLNKMGINREEH